MCNLINSALLENWFFGPDWRRRALKSIPVTFLATLSLVFASQLAQAGKVEIHGDNPRQSVTVSADNATLGDVLKHSSQVFEFEVLGLSKLGPTPPMTVTFSGSLEKVLARLLRNRNYMIFRTTGNRCGIRKVSILNDNYGSTPPSNQQRRQRKYKGSGSRLKRQLTARSSY